MTAPTVAETAGVVGVEIRAPRGRITVRGGAYAIGQIVIRPDDTVLVIPRHGLSERGIQRLLSVATRAAIIGRGHCRSWIHESDIGWITTCYTWAWPGPTINDHDLGGGQ